MVELLPVGHRWYAWVHIVGTLKQTTDETLPATSRLNIQEVLKQEGHFEQ